MKFFTICEEALTSLAIQKCSSFLIKKSLIKLVAVAGSFVQKFGRTLVHRISF